MLQEYSYSPHSGFVLQAPRIMVNSRLSLSKPEASSGQVVLTALGLPSTTLATSAAAPAVSGVKFTPTAFGRTAAGQRHKPLAYMQPSRSDHDTNPLHRSHACCGLFFAPLWVQKNSPFSPLRLVFVGVLRSADILGLLISQHFAVIGRRSNPAPLPLKYCDCVLLGFLLMIWTPAERFKTLKTNLALVFPKYYFIIA